MASNILLLTFLYFIQGLPYGFQVKFLPIYLRSQGSSLTQVSLLKVLLLPWLCKALWAPLVDKWGTKQKWLCFSILGLVASCILGAVLPKDCWGCICVVLFLLNVFAAMQDIAADAVAVLVLSDAELGHGNSAQVVGYKIGSIFGGGVLVMLMEYIGWRGMFVALSLVYMEAAMFVYLSPVLRFMSEPKKIIHKNSPSSVDDPNKYESTHCPGDPLNDQKDDYTQIRGSDTEADSLEDVDEWKQSEDEEDYARDADINSECPMSETITSGQNQTISKIFKAVLKSDGTRWVAGFVLIYKLGEQGMVSMLPLFLVDQKMSASDVSFWSGVVGQAVSIAGSLASGWLISRHRIPAGVLVHQLCLLNMMPQGMVLVLLTMWYNQLLSRLMLHYLSIICMNGILLVGGMLTTATFTLMMECSRTAPPVVQATHYTTLATLEVLGKLLFMSVSGFIVDSIGHRQTYLLFVMLSGMTVVWLNRIPEQFVTLGKYHKPTRVTNEDDNYDDDDDDDNDDINEEEPEEEFTEHFHKKVD